jgi:hypothetical protein
VTRTRWVALIVVLMIALFAVVVGGFLWPRPQFRRGPWTGPGPAPEGSPGQPIEAPAVP